MAAGAIVIDTGGVTRAGNYMRLTGTIEADSTAREFAIVPNGFIISASLHNTADDDTTIRVVRNSDDGTEDSKAGSLYVQTSSADDDLHRFEILYV